MSKNVIGQADHGAPPTPFFKRAKKAFAAVCGMGATLLAAGALDGKAEAIVSGLLGIATVYGVYQAKNARA